MSEVSPEQHRNIIWDIKRSGVQAHCAKYKCMYGVGNDDAVPVVTRGAVVTNGTQVYFSLSSYGYECPERFRRLIGFEVPHYVFSYNMIGDEWSTLPPCEVHDFGLTIVDGLVTIVGGQFDQISLSVSPVTSRRLSVLQNREWIDDFPPMTMKRRGPSVICAQHYLIAAGGGYHLDHFSSVEVMNTNTKVWSQVASLPEVASSLVAAHCGDQLYFLGGKNDDGSMNSVFTCSIQSLIKSSFVMPALEEDLRESAVKSPNIGSEEKLKQQANENRVWRRVADVPVLRSTCVVINGELFAIGGRTSTYRSSADIYCYNRFDDSWQVVGQMPTGRSMCIAASVMNKLVVIGGLKERDEPTDVIEIGTFISDSTLTKKNIWPQLISLDDWYNLGLQLDITDDKLRETEDAHPGKPARCKDETVDHWLKRGKNPSWETLATAVAGMGHLDIATQIREKYLQPADDSIHKKSKASKRKIDDSTDVLPEMTSDFPQLGEKPELADALKFVYPLAKKWKNIGAFLKLPPYKLDMIDVPQKDFDDCLRDMLSVWLKQIDPPPTWQALVDAVQIIDPCVARQISH